MFKGLEVISKPISGIILNLPTVKVENIHPPFSKGGLKNLHSKPFACCEYIFRLRHVLKQVQEK
jgi:hypothetical protein